MGSWNHRIVTCKTPEDRKDLEGEYNSAIAEVYYDDKGEITGFCIRRAICEDMKWLLDKYNKALELPEIEVSYKDFWNAAHSCVHNWGKVE